MDRLCTAQVTRLPNDFEIEWLTDEQIAKFKSDFGIVARFFSERRKNPDYVPDDRTVITHVDAI